MIPAKPFYMIRHGESTANAKKILAGQSPTPLTERGIEQAQQERSILENMATKPSIIIHSPLARAKHTAEIMNENLQLPMLEESDLQEQNFGDWEETPYEHCLGDLRDGIDPPNGESHTDFNARIQNIKNVMLQDHHLPLFVCHGCVFFAFYRLYQQELPWIENARLYSFTPIENPTFPWYISIIGDAESSDC